MRLFTSDKSPEMDRLFVCYISAARALAEVQYRETRLTGAGESALKRVSYDTNENRLLKFTLMNISRVWKKSSLEGRKLRAMAAILKMPFLNGVDAGSTTINFHMEPVCRKLYICYLELIRIFADSEAEEKGFDCWGERNVLVGDLKNPGQLDICLKHNFYHVPVMQLESDWPIEYVAIYQSRTYFGDFSGIRYYGKALSTKKVKRNEILEIPKQSDEIYYLIKIEKWNELPRPIMPKESGLVRKFTNLYLLSHASELPQLWLKNKEDFELYEKLMPLAAGDSTKSFIFGSSRVVTDGDQIRIYSADSLTASFSADEFYRAPLSIFYQIKEKIGGEKSNQVSK